jgi:hypothetical protein
MSERGTWMTDFIYCGDTVTALREYFQAERCPDNKYFTVQELFEHQHCGAFCGRIGGMYPGEELHSMEGLIPEIEQIIKTPIRICVFAEDGSQIFEIDPAGDNGKLIEDKLLSDAEATVARMMKAVKLATYGKAGLTPVTKPTSAKCRRSK